MKKILTDICVTVIILTIMCAILHAIFGPFNNWIAMIGFIVGGAVTDIKRMNEHGNTE